MKHSARQRCGSSSQLSSTLSRKKHFFADHYKTILLSGPVPVVDSEDVDLLASTLTLISRYTFDDQRLNLVTGAASAWAAAYKFMVECVAQQVDPMQIPLTLAVSWSEAHAACVRAAELTKNALVEPCLDEGFGTVVSFLSKTAVLDADHPCIAFMKKVCVREDGVQLTECRYHVRGIAVTGSMR